MATSQKLQESLARRISAKTNSHIKTHIRKNVIYHRKNDGRISAKSNIVFYSTPGGTENTIPRTAIHTTPPAPRQHSQSHDIRNALISDSVMFKQEWLVFHRFILTLRHTGARDQCRGPQTQILAGLTVGISAKPLQISAKPMSESARIEVSS